MQADVPHQFLIGAVRLIAVYYGLRALDAVQSAIMAYQIQLSTTPDLAKSFPSVWSIYLPSLIIYVSLILLVWFAAPRICGRCTATRSESTEEPPTGISWNETMIFLFGTLFVALGITRIGDELIQLMPRDGKSSPSVLGIRNQLQFYIGIILAGGGAVMCSRFAGIYRWMLTRAKKT